MRQPIKNKTVVFFDVDNCLIRGYSQKFLLLYFRKLKKLSLFNFLKISSLFFLYKSGFLKYPQLIQKFAYKHFKGLEKEEAEVIFENFFKTKIVPCFIKEALQTIKRHKNAQEEVVIISTSLKEIVKRIANFLSVKFYFATSLSLKNGIYTGRIEGLIPYGENKLKLAKKFLKENFPQILNTYAYADDYSDKFLLEFVNYPVCVNPHSKLKKLALKRNWKIVKW